MKKEFNKDRKGKSGTREWSEYSLNVGLGCSNGCLYCYARSGALVRGLVSSPEDWKAEKVFDKEFKFGRRKGVTMFPTQHDITPAYLAKSIEVLKGLLDAENNVLIVSKPNYECIKALLAELKGYNKDKILFRFTIGHFSNKVGVFWEPGAPSARERIQCLAYVYARGFQTSVSMEPMLAGTEDAITLFHILKPYITDKVWIGKMNKPRQRVETKHHKAISEIESLQSDGAILRLHDALKDEPKVEWKDSILEVLREAGA